MITERDLEILRILCRYFVLCREQIQRLLFPQDSNGRITRRRLQVLVEGKLINRQSTEPSHPSQTPVPVYFPSRKGTELLAEHCGDDHFLATSTQPPIPHHVLHWLAVSETHIALDAAIAQQSQVKLEGWINEWDTVNKDESAPEKKYRLYTLLRESPRLVCAPDAAFLLSVGGVSKVFYLEQDRATSGVHQIASSKTAGYAVLSERKLHHRHFSNALDEFSILMIAPSERRRDALKKALQGKPGSNLWRFAATRDFVPEKALFDPIWYSCDRAEPRPMVKRPDGSTPAASGILPHNPTMTETPQ